MTMQTTKSHRLRSAALLATCLLALTFALAACSSSGSSKSSSTTQGTSASSGITMQNIAFVPASVSAKAGSTVTITNSDQVSHTVTSDDGTSFNVTVPGGKTATITAPAKPGTYKFHCNIHSQMHGTLVVT
jgi:plastocyanin